MPCTQSGLGMTVCAAWCAVRERNVHSNLPLQARSSQIGQILPSEADARLTLARQKPVWRALGRRGTRNTVRLGLPYSRRAALERAGSFGVRVTSYVTDGYVMDTYVGIATSLPHVHCGS